jgi:hypothetical protein
MRRKENLNITPIGRQHLAIRGERGGRDREGGEGRESRKS